jgi:hypothetical protein
MTQCKVVELTCSLHLQRDEGSNFLANRVSMFLNKNFYIPEERNQNIPVRESLALKV